MAPPPPREWSRPGTHAGLRAGPAAGRFDRSGEPERQGWTATFFAFAQAWAAGIVVLVVTQYLQMTLLYENLVGRYGPQSWGSALGLVHLPNLVCIALATWAAARMHPEPQSARTGRHATAAFTVPVAAHLFTLAASRNVPGFDALTVCMTTAVLVTGCVVGWSAERWLRAGRG